MNVNIYDISQKHDPAKVYSKTFNEKQYPSMEAWFEAVEKYQNRLEVGIFAYKGDFYFAKFKRIDLTERDVDTTVNQVTTICRKVKFKWEYVFLK
jgi:hypothetical protein